MVTEQFERTTTFQKQTDKTQRKPQQKKIYHFSVAGKYTLISIFQLPLEGVGPGKYSPNSKERSRKA